MNVKIVELPYCPLCGCDRCDCGAEDFYDAVVNLQAKVEALEAEVDIEKSKRTIAESKRVRFTEG